MRIDQVPHRFSDGVGLMKSQAIVLLQCMQRGNDYRYVKIKGNVPLPPDVYPEAIVEFRSKSAGVMYLHTFISTTGGKKHDVESAQVSGA